MSTRRVKFLLSSIAVLAALSGCGANATTDSARGLADTPCRSAPTPLEHPSGFKFLGKVDPIVPPTAPSSGHMCEYERAGSGTWRLTERQLSDEELRQLTSLATLTNEPAIYEWVRPGDVDNHIVELRLTYGDENLTLQHDLGASVTISVVGGDSIMNPEGAALIRNLVGD